jgi:hypothetical protein
MNEVKTTKRRIASIAFIAILTAATQAVAQNAGAPYPKMAALDAYLMAPDAEIALARTAAPDSISKDADIWVLDRHGYRTAVKGHNGFTCAVERSWTAHLDDAGFWNPKARAPICYNAAATRSFLPRVVKRTELILAGKSKEQVSSEMNAAFAANKLSAIEPGSMSYMLSKQGYLNDQAGHWHPHVMVYVSETDMAGWGANLPGSPVLADSDHTDRVTVFMVPVHKWSDGSMDSGDMGSH